MKDSGNVFPALRNTICSNIPRRKVHLEHRILEVWSHQIQFPHHNGLQSSVCSQEPAMHMGTASSFPLLTSHNTVRPHSAYDPRLPASYLSGYRAEYRVPAHLLHKYNVYRSLLPVQFPSPVTCASMPD